MNRKNMKLLLCLVLVLSMLGCGAKEKEASNVKVEEIQSEMTKEEKDAFNKAVIEKEFADEEFVVKEPVKVEVVEKEPKDSEMKETYVIEIDEEDIEIEIGVSELTEEEEKEFEKGSSDNNANENLQENQPKTEFCCAYSKYRNMTGEEQKNFARKFSDMDAFFEWHDQAEVEHEKHDTSIEIGSGVIDMNEILEGEQKSE